MLISQAELANKLKSLQAGQGVEVSSSELIRLFGTGAPNEDALKAAESFAAANDCTFFYEGRAHDQRALFRKSFPPT